jgi:glycosyltransferase involved in cell wall biosynthesis
MNSPKPLRVCIDLTPLPKSKAGVGRYAFGLLGGLQSAVASGNLELICFAKSQDAAEIAAAAPYAEVVEVGPFKLGRPIRLAWEQTRLPALIRKARADVFHGIHYSLPLASSIPSTVVLHDPTFWTHPEFHTAAKVAYFRAMARLAARRSRLVFTVSRWSKQHLCDHLGIEDQKIRVAYHGVDDFLFEPVTPEALQSMRDRLGASDAKLVAFVGTVEPRKNLPRLVMAVEILRRRLGEPGVVLAIAGQRGWKIAEAERWIERGRRKGWLVDMGYIDEPTKRVLLQAADCFAYVSLAEGFGIPVLEAFASGTPVVTSDRTATAEVAGDAAALVDPYDVFAIAEALESVLVDDTTLWRLVEAGRARAAEFSWEAAGRETLAGWLEAAGRS